MSDDVEFLREKQRECLVRAKAFEIWLDFLTPLRWLTIFIGVVFPAIAGFSLLSNAPESSFLGVQWRTISAVLTLLASIVAALHAALHCDAHQTGCKKLGPLFENLSDEFRIAATESDPKVRRKIRESLAKRLAELKSRATEKPGRWAIQRAESLIPQVDASIDSHSDAA